MSGSLKSRIGIGLVVAAAIFGAAILIPRLLKFTVLSRIAATQAIELGLAILAIVILGKAKFADYGFRLPRPDRPIGGALMRWIPVGLLALAVGAAATVSTLATGGAGNPIAKQLTFPQILLFVMLLSSTIEEIFMRGFLQSHIALGETVDPAAPRKFIDRPTWISAAAFASMHLILLASGMDIAGLVITLLFTFAVGLIAGTQRSRTGSLVPAIGVHLLANAGGMLGGIIYAVISVATGHGLPGQ